MILGKAFLRRAKSCGMIIRAQIPFPADPIVDFFRERIEKKSVDGEIAAQRVGLGAGKDNFLRPPTVLVISLQREKWRPGIAVCLR